MPNARYTEGPVTAIPTDASAAPPEDGMALCLSGGGYRAMLFHVGSLWRLSDVGYLRHLKRVSSVSGGSITAAVLGLHWSQLGFDAGGVARDFQDRVVDPIRALARLTIDVWSVLGGLVSFGSISDQVASAYRQHLFGAKTLQDLPADTEGPRFVINATNVQSGALWRFSRPYAADWRVGTIPSPTIELAVAVAASSAFPPFLSPTYLTFPPGLCQPEPGNDLHVEPYTTNVVLTDGGVYDNLGLETAWKRYTTILVSNGGEKQAPEASPAADWLRHTLRALLLINDQVQSLRQRWLIHSYELPAGHPDHRKGTYWSTRSDIRRYALPPMPDYPFNATTCPIEKTSALASVTTRLSALDDTTQERLINWGYAMCDVALRTHVDASLPLPSGFPYPAVGVG